MATGNQEGPAAPTVHCPLRGGEGIAPVPDGRQPSSIRKFLGGMSMSAVPTVALMLISFVPMLWFFLLPALLYWFLSLLAVVFVMRTQGFSVSLGVLAGCVIGAAVFVAYVYYLISRGFLVYGS